MANESNDSKNEGSVENPMRNENFESNCDKCDVDISIANHSESCEIHVSTSLSKLGVKRNSESANRAELFFDNFVDNSISSLFPGSY